MIEFLQVSNEGNPPNLEDSDILNPNELSKAIVEQLLDENSIDHNRFVCKNEWNVYTDFAQFSHRKEPKIYSDITL